MASNIPKFTSFRPKPKDPPAPTEKTKSEERPEKLERQSRERKPSRERAPKRVPEPSSRVKEQSKSFFIDRRGDPDNLKYGYPNRYEIPRYRRHGYGNVLGLPVNLKIDREQSSDRAIVLTGQSSRRQERLLTSKHTFKESERKLRFVKVGSAAALEKNADFIGLSGTKKRKRDDESESEEKDYRSIERSNDKKSPLDSDLESESGTELDQANSETTRKNAALIQRTRDRPDDLNAWMDFIEHQEAMLTLGRSSATLSASDRMNLANVRASIFEQAIRTIGEHSGDQIKLHLGLLDEASRVWNEAKLSDKWSDLLRKYPSSPEVWMKYLDYAQGGLTSFEQNKCRACFQRCLKALHASSTPVAPEIYLHILVRLTAMLRSAGYQELASAIWMALLQLHFKKANDRNRMQALEAVWDSEVPRIGETDLFDEEAAFLGLESTPLSQKQPSAPIFEDFGLREREHMDRLKLPGRIADEIGEDDPFHLVFFSDMEEYLSTFPEDTPDTMLVEAFLCYYGMPPFPDLGSSRRSWWLDPFLHRRSLRVGLSGAENKTVTQLLDTFARSCPSNSQMTLESLIDYGFPPQATAASSDLSENGLSVIDLEFIRRTLRWLTTISTLAEPVGEYLLAFEHSYFPSTSRKVAKRLLTRNSSSLRLYNAYGLIELRSGSLTKAEQVFRSALSLQKNAAPLTLPGSLHLFNSWLWEALDRGDMAEALWRFASPLGDTPTKTSDRPDTPDPASLLRGRTALSEAKERALLGRNFIAAVICTSLLAILAYISNEKKPEVALEIHNKLSGWFLERGLRDSSGAELHAQSIARFLAYHASTAPIVKPALLRNALEPLINQFPNNTILLSLYAANEARFSIDDRVRSIVHQNIFQTSKRSTITSWLFAIAYEMQRGEIAGSTSHSVRALFQKAEDDIGAHCPGLWKTHVFFELAEYEKEVRKRPAPPKKQRGRDEKDRKGKKDKKVEETRVQESARRVKETFLRGITKLPWDKEYMMLAFRALRGVLSEEDLRRVYDVMCEKELRVYVSVDG